MLISDIAGIESTNKTRVLIMTLTGVSCVASIWGGGGVRSGDTYFIFYFSFFGVANVFEVRAGRDINRTACPGSKRSIYQKANLG